METYHDTSRDDAVYEDGQTNGWMDKGISVFPSNFNCNRQSKLTVQNHRTKQTSVHFLSILVLPSCRDRAGNGGGMLSQATKLSAISSVYVNYGEGLTQIDKKLCAISSVHVKDVEGLSQSDN